MSYKRLTDKKVKGTIERYIRVDKDYILSAYDIIDKEKQDFVEMIINRLAELEDKIENGTLIELPCKIGSTVYHIYNAGRSKYIIDEETVSGYELEIDALIGVVLRIMLNASTPSVAVIGDRLFFTRAEAEKKLKELKGEE